MQWLKARRKLIVGILMLVTLIVVYSSKSSQPVKTFLVLTAVTCVVIAVEVAVLRILARQR
jgi:hypothetical protein